MMLRDRIQDAVQLAGKASGSFYGEDNPEIVQCIALSFGVMLGTLYRMTEMLRDLQTELDTWPEAGGDK